MNPYKSYLGQLNSLLEISNDDKINKKYRKHHISDINEAYLFLVVLDLILSLLQTSRNWLV
jgi:hypothetical protein